MEYFPVTKMLEHRDEDSMKVLASYLSVVFSNGALSVRGEKPSLGNSLVVWGNPMGSLWLTIQFDDCI